MKLIKFILLILLLANFAFAEGNTFKVKKLGGQVTYLGKTIAVDEQLSPGSVIEVENKEGSFVDLSHSEGHHLRLKKGAKLKLELSDPKEPHLLDLLYGQLYVFYRKGKEAKPLNIKTRTAVAGVRGTKFLIEEKDEGSYYCVCDGVIEVTKEGVTRQVKKDEDLRSRPGKPLGVPKVSPDMGKMTESEFKSMGL